MLTSLVRDVALVVAANSLVAGRDVQQLWPDDPLFQFTRDCVFIDDVGATIAANPDGWLERFRTGFKGVWLHHAAKDQNDRMTVAFAGGGPRWILEAVRDGSSELWEGNDSIGDRNDADGRIWKTGYVRITADWKEDRREPASIESIKAELNDVLAELATFAQDHDLMNFADNFGSAILALEGTPRRDALFAHAEMPYEARQLWQAVGAAWVFGGMGSWNDMSFDGEVGKTYETLSGALYERLNEAVAAVANSTWPMHKAPPPTGGKSWWQRLTGD